MPWKKGAAVTAAVLITLLFLLWAYHVRESLLVVLTPFMISLILAYLLSPVIQYMEKRKISRTVAIITVYLIFSIMILVFCVRVMPLFLDDLEELVLQLPQYSSALQEFFHQLEMDYRRFNLPQSLRDIVDSNIENLSEALTAQLARSYDFLLDLFGRILLLLLVPILTFYLIRDARKLRESFFDLFPGRMRNKLDHVAADIDLSLGAFIRGALLVSLAVAALTYIGLLILGVNFSLVLAIIIGITNMIPYIGPIIGALPAVLVAFLDSPFLALKVIVLIVIIQQAESQLIVPVVIGRSTRLHPLAIILVLLLGGKLFGLSGLILAVPAAIIIRVVAGHIFDYLKTSH